MTVRRRFLLGTLAVLAAVLLASLALLAWQDAAYSASDARDRLASMGMAQRLVEQQKNIELSTRAELIARNQAVVGYIVQALDDSLPGMEQDRASIVDLLDEQRDLTGLVLAAVLDGRGQLVTTTERFAPSTDLGNAPLFIEARERKAISKGLWQDDKRLLHVAILPLAAYGYREAYLLVAMPVNQLLAESIAQLGHGEAAFLTETSEGPLVVASTVNPALHNALLAMLPAADMGSEPGDLHLAGQRYFYSESALFSSTSGRLVAFVSVGEDSTTARALRFPLALGAVAVFLAAMLMAWLLWTRWLVPAEALAGIMERAADTRDRHLSAPETGALPMRRLSTAFNRLLAGLSARSGPRTSGS